MRTQTLIVRTAPGTRTRGVLVAGPLTFRWRSAVAASWRTSGKATAQPRADGFA